MTYHTPSETSEIGNKRAVPESRCLPVRYETKDLVSERGLSFDPQRGLFSRPNVLLLVAIPYPG